ASSRRPRAPPCPPVRVDLQRRSFRARHRARRKPSCSERILVRRLEKPVLLSKCHTSSGRVTWAGMISDAEGRLAASLRRELGAVDVRFLRSGEPSGPPETALACPVPDGPVVVADFEEPPADREAKARRMEMIVASFADLLAAAPTDAARHHRHASPARSLAGELTALAGRAGALSVLVVDARSPVIWGASDSGDVAEEGAEETGGARLN